MDRSKASRDPSEPQSDSDQTAEVLTVVTEESTTEDEHASATEHNVEAAENVSAREVFTGEEEHQRGATAAEAGQLGQEQSENNHIEDDKGTGSETTPDNMTCVESEVTDPDRGYLEAMSVWSDPLGVPAHESRSEARSTRSGDDVQSQQDVESDSEDPTSSTTYLKMQKLGVEPVRRGRTVIPNNTAALGRNLSRNSLLTISPGLLLGEYSENVLDGTARNEDASRQLPNLGDESFPMVKLARTRTGETVICINSKLRVFRLNEITQVMEEVDTADLGEQIQDVKTDGQFVYVQLPTSIKIYKIHNGKLEYYRSIDRLDASSGRLEVHGGYLYSTREHQRVIKRINRTTGERRIFLSDLRRPGAITADPNGEHIFFADDHDIRIVDALGNSRGVIQVGGPIDSVVFINGILNVLTLQELRRYKHNPDTDSWDLL